MSSNEISEPQCGCNRNRKAQGGKRMQYPGLLVRMRRDIVLVYLFFQLIYNCRRNNWDSLTKMTWEDLATTIDALPDDQREYISIKIQELFSAACYRILLHSFSLSISPHGKDGLALHVRLLRIDFSDSFNMLKKLLEMFAFFVSGAMVTGETEIWIRYLPSDDLEVFYSRFIQTH
jgi:hypothetical protein